MRTLFTLMFSLLFLTNVLAETCTNDRQNHLAFLSQPENTVVFLQQTATLIATVEFPDSVAFQWYFNDEPITGANDDTLLVKYTNYADTGDYICEISNICGFEFTTPARVDIKEIPQGTLTEEATLRYFTGSSNATAYARGVSVDSDNNSYTVVQFRDTIQFDSENKQLSQRTTVDPVNGSQYDICVVKHSPTQEIMWALQLGTLGADLNPDIVTDSEGNSYVSFVFLSNIELKINGVKTILSPIESTIETNAFIKIDSDGNVLWAHTLGGRRWNYSPKLAVTDNDKIIYMGVFDKLGFDADFSANEYSVGDGANDGNFVAVYDTDANLQWVQSIMETGTSFNDEVQFRYLSVDNANNRLVVAGDWAGPLQYEKNGAMIDSVSSGSHMIMECDLATGEINELFSFKAELDDFFDIAHDSRGNLLVLLRTRKNAFDFALIENDEYILPEVTQSYQTQVIKYDPSYKVVDHVTFVANTNNVSRKIFTDDHSNIYISLNSGYSVFTSLIGEDAKTFPYGGHMLKFSPDFRLLMDKHIKSQSTAAFYDAKVVDNNRIVSCGIYQGSDSYLNPDQPSVITPSNSKFSGFLLSMPIEEHVNEFECIDFAVELGQDSIKCEGQSKELSPIFVPEGSVNYMWSTGESTPTITVDEDNIYYVTVSGIDLCETSVDSITITTLSVTADILPETAEVESGSEFYLKAQVSDEINDYHYSWQSGLKVLDTYKSYVQVKAGETGSFNVSLVATEKSSGCTAMNSRTITVSEQSVDLESISFMSTNEMVAVNERIDLYVISTPLTADISEFNWVSSDNSIATVVDGKVSALSEGVVTITVSSADEPVSNEVEVTVYKPVVARSLTLPQTLCVLKGESAELTPVLYPQNATIGEYVWQSTNINVATVDANGVVQAIAVGSCVVTVSDAMGEVYTSTIVTVSEEAVTVTDLYLPSTMQAQVGEEIIMPLTLVPYNASHADIVWSTSDGNIATVDANGVVTILESGFVTIIATVLNTIISKSVTIEAGVSLPPMIKPMPDQYLTLDSDGVVIDLSLYISDDVTSTESLLVYETSSDNVFTGLSNNQLTISVTQSTVVGSEDITITVTDEEGMSATATLGVFISESGNIPDNQVAIVELPNVMFASGQTTIELDVANYATNGANVSSVNVTDSENVSSFVEGTNVALSKADEWKGSETVSIEITLESGVVITEEVEVSNAGVVNMAPVVLDIPEQVNNAEQSFRLTNLNLYVQDDYTLPSAIYWSFSATSNISIEEVNNAFKASVKNPYWSGKETVWFIAEDEQGLKDSVEVFFIVESTLETPVEIPNLFAAVAQTTTITPNKSMKLWVDRFSPSSLPTDYVWEIQGATFVDDVNIGVAVDVMFANAGVYSVKVKAVTDAGVDSVIVTDYIRVLGIEPRSEIVCYGNSTELTFNGAGSETLLWSTGSTDDAITLTPEKTMEVAVTAVSAKSGVVFTYTDIITVTVGIPVDLGADTSICFGTSYDLKPEGYETYSWSFNGNTLDGDVATIDKAGFYGLTVTDEYGCETSDELVIENVNPLPTVELLGAPSICMEDTLWLDAGNYISFEWNDGSTEQRLPATETGTYEVTVVDNNGCINSASFDLFVQKPFNEAICMATVSDDGGVLIAWERTKDQGTAYYELFKVAYGDTALVATVPYDSLSVVLDADAKIDQQAYRYLLKTTDTCGNTSDYSPYHQTIYLTATEEVNTGGVALSWTSYEGAPIDGYNIFEAKDGELNKIANASAFENGYTVENHVSGTTYRVGVELETCSPAVLKLDSGPFSQSMSNLSEAIITSGVSESNVSIQALPNPTDGLFGVVIDGVSTEYLITVTDANGSVVTQVVKNIDGAEVVSIDIIDKPSGIYYVKVVTESSVSIEKITKY